MSNSENDQFETIILYYWDIIKINFGILTKKNSSTNISYYVYFSVYKIKKKQYRINIKIF